MNNLLSSLAGNNKDGAAVNGQSPPVNAVSLINLNEVVHNSLIAGKGKIDAIQAIIRYDVLPQVHSDALGVSRAFSIILNSILDYPPSGTKLFIYIRCEREITETMNLSLPEGFQQFCISVYTNISTDAGWQQAQQPYLEELNSYMQNIGAEFKCQPIYNTGCLYTIALPGKLI